jgi:hypothetical protein
MSFHLSNTLASKAIYQAPRHHVQFGQQKPVTEMSNTEYMDYIKGKALSNGRYIVFKDAVQRGVSQSCDHVEIEGEKHLLGTEGRHPYESIWLFPYRNGKGVGKIALHQF